MILTKESILKEIHNKRIKVEPFVLENVGPGSLDLTLSNEFRTFKKIHNIVEISEHSDFTNLTNLEKTDDYFVIMPGESVFGITVERITLPPDICGWLEGRSTFARFGLMVHITASYIQPGIDNRQVLEMFNASQIPLAIKSGLKICQFIFERCEGSAVYQGRYKNQQL
ncbi:MAG: dCTP deaminase [Gammaproteobacteria bacterium]|nr:dCTP deaminase [Gammaproteobacteria bacterium]